MEISNKNAGAGKRNGSNNLGQTENKLFLDEKKAINRINTIILGCDLPWRSKTKYGLCAFSMVKNTVTSQRNVWTKRKAGSEH